MRRARSLLVLLLVATTLVASAPGPATADRRRPPPWIRGDIRRTVYDGVTDDLLTAGLGRSELASAVPATPRAGGAGQAFTEAHLPPIAAAPAGDAAITFDGAQLTIPQ